MDQGRAPHKHRVEKAACAAPVIERARFFPGYQAWPRLCPRSAIFNGANRRPLPKIYFSSSLLAATV